MEPAANSDARRAGAVPLPRDAAESLSRTLRAIADPTRLQLLSMMIDIPSGEVTVGELVSNLDLGQPTVSHHLRIMVSDGLLHREPRGRHVWYSIASDRRSAVLDILR